MPPRNPQAHGRYEKQKAEREKQRKALDSALAALKAQSGAKVEPKVESKEKPKEDERPDLDFIREVNPDLTLAIRQEDALGFESELEADMEQVLINEDVEPWAARLLREAWSTEPMPEQFEEFGKYRIDPEAFKELNTKDPLEIMAYAQCTALQSTILFRLREAGRRKVSPEVEERRYRAIAKLSDSFTKLMTAVQNSRKKGEQRVSVRYEHHDRAATTKLSQTRTRKLTINRSGSEAEFGQKDKSKEPEPITVEVAAEKQAAKKAMGTGAPDGK